MAEMTREEMESRYNEWADWFNEVSELIDNTPDWDVLVAMQKLGYIDADDLDVFNDFYDTVAAWSKVLIDIQFAFNSIQFEEDGWTSYNF